MNDEPELVARSVHLANGREAQLLEAPPDAKAPEILAALGLQPVRPVIAIVGGANKLDKRVEPRLAQLLSRAVARVAANRHAVIIDGGTRAGVMTLTGQGVADQGYRSELVGVAPAGRVTFPEHPTRA